MINIAIIGLGRVFDHYLSIWEEVNNKFPDIKVVATCDKNKNLKNKGNALNCSKFYTDIESLIKSTKDIDLALICTPGGLHYENSKILLENNIHVLCEKPLALKTKHIIELNEIATMNNLHYGAIFQNRFNPAIKFAKEFIKKGGIGKPLILDISLLWSRPQSYYEDDWHGRWDLDGGVICQQAIHHLDAAFFINGPIAKVSSMQSNLRNKLEAEDTHLALLKFENNVQGTFKATTSLGPKDQEASLSIYGSNGHIKIAGIALNEVKEASTNGEELNKEILLSNSMNVASGYGSSHIDFFIKTFENIKNNNFIPICNAYESAHISSVIHSFYLSSEKSTQSFKNVKLDNDFSLLGMIN